MGSSLCPSSNRSALPADSTSALNPKHVAFQLRTAQATLWRTHSAEGLCSKCGCALECSPMSDTPMEAETATGTPVPGDVVTVTSEAKAGESQGNLQQIFEASPLQLQRLFLEHAALDVRVPAEERAVAKHLLDTYLVPRSRQMTAVDDAHSGRLLTGIVGDRFEDDDDEEELEHVQAEVDVGAARRQQDKDAQPEVGQMKAKRMSPRRSKEKRRRSGRRSLKAKADGGDCVDLLYGMQTTATTLASVRSGVLAPLSDARHGLGFDRDAMALLLEAVNDWCAFDVFHYVRQCGNACALPALLLTVCHSHRLLKAKESGTAMITLSSEVPSTDGGGRLRRTGSLSLSKKRMPTPPPPDSGFCSDSASTKADESETEEVSAERLSVSREALEMDEIKLMNYLRQVSAHYNENPYHSVFHACDVTVSMAYFLNACIFENIDTFDKLAVLISACVHDVGHPGNSNAFEINTETALATTYNDHSVLENYHVALAWRLLTKSEDCNFLHGFSRDEKKRFREVMITTVLATDMNEHSTHLQRLQELVEKKDSIWDYDSFAIRFLPIALHSADLANPCKPLAFYREWVYRLVEREFFEQGDAERRLGLAPSFLCDRRVVNVASGQVGFINFVIRPWWRRLALLLDEPMQGQLFLQMLESNFEAMQKLAKEETEERLRAEEAENGEEELVVVVDDEEHVEDAQGGAQRGEGGMVEVVITSAVQSDLGKLVEVETMSGSEAQSHSATPRSPSSKLLSAAWSDDDAEILDTVKDDAFDAGAPKRFSNRISSKPKLSMRSSASRSIVAASMDEISKQLSGDYSKRMSLPISATFEP